MQRGCIFHRFWISSSVGRRGDVRQILGSTGFLFLSRHLRRVGIRVGICTGLGLAVMGAAAPEREARANDLDFEVIAGAGVAWRRTMPTLETTSPTTTAAREVGESRVAIGGPMVALGGSFEVAMTVDDRIVIPVLGFAGYGAIGSYDTIVTSVDGSIARVRPWTTYEIDVLLPGIGYRLKQRRYMFGASLRSGVSALNVSGTIAGGANETPFSASGLSLLVQGELEACRRLDPVTRVCAIVAPRIYDFGFMNGATFGLRVEWGR